MVDRGRGGMRRGRVSCSHCGDLTKGAFHERSVGASVAGAVGAASRGIRKKRHRARRGVVPGDGARFGLTEARRLKALLGLGEHPGLDGLAAALLLRFQSVANACTVRREEGAVVYRIETCRVQQARNGKGLGYHPCKQVGVVEHPAFARGIDERLSCTCLSCYPNVTDDTCSCAWRFTLRVP